MDAFLLVLRAMQSIRKADLQTAAHSETSRGSSPTWSEATANLHGPGSVNATKCLLMERA